MAKKEKSEKPPGRFRQIWRAYKVTAKQDPNSVWISVLGLVITFGVVLTTGLLLDGNNPWVLALWVTSAIITSVLVGMLIMSKRAERSAYSQIEGQQGAVGAVIEASLKKSWRGAAMPVSVNPKSRDAVYRVIGSPGVVLIGEGPASRVQQMMNDETKKIKRAVPGVEIHRVFVGTDEGQVRLHSMMKSIQKIKRSLRRREIQVVSKRLEALGNNMPIPKGIDPMRFRPSRKQ